MSEVPLLLVLWCPDWAVFLANRVVVCSAAARRSGVGRGWLCLVL